MDLITRIELAGYKSIADASIDLRPMNVLIGANGGGKSNLISFFRMLRAVARGELQRFVAVEGGADALVYRAERTAPEIRADLRFLVQDTEGGYSFSLVRAGAQSLVFHAEEMAAPIAAHAPLGQRGENREWPVPAAREGASRRSEPGESRCFAAESPLVESADSEPGSVRAVGAMLSRLSVFHFHDTSATSPMRQGCYVHDNAALADDGRNLAAVIHRLQETQPAFFWRIRETIRQFAPWFGDFSVEPLRLNPNSVLLNWREAGSNAVFGPHQLPDGALRAIALVVLLLQPECDLPPLIVIDEPELGLHPHVLHAMAGLIRAAALHRQVIVATQSSTFVDEFEAKDIVVVERENGRTGLQRLDEESLQEWLQEYSLGELWEKNVLG